jgi:hypothetical protein
VLIDVTNWLEKQYMITPIMLFLSNLAIGGLFNLINIGIYKTAGYS